MSSPSYKDALRAKGIRPCPPARELRSSLSVAGRVIDATRSTILELEAKNLAGGWSRVEA